jgi:hypothetical protein
MGKNKKEYWSSISSKPKGFSFVKGCPMTYTYEVPVHLWHFSKPIDKVFIQVKMKRNEYSGVDIIDEFVTESILKEIGDNFSWENSLFKRDGALFPFVSKIEIVDKDKYFNFKKLKNRRLKLEQIKNKIH